MINRDRPKYFRKQSASERLVESLSNLRKENPRIFFLVIISPCILLGLVLGALVGVNQSRFRNFLRSVTPSEIEKIDIQQIDINGIGISDPITVTDEEPIVSFVTTINAAQDYYPSRYTELNRTKVTVWLRNQHTIEFWCYTIKDHGKSVFVDNIWLKPNIYSFGNGNVEFPEPEFYNWLLSNGVVLE